MKWIVGITGGSCAIYGVALLKALQQLGVETHLVVSKMGEAIIKHECGMDLEDVKSLASFYHENTNLAAPIASGSFQVDGMLIVPCSMNTLASVASGISNNLVTRAADVTIKEGRKLIVLPREMPLSVIHLENMLKLARIGVKIIPAAPGFYHQPQTIGDLVSMVVGRILDQAGINHYLCKRWGE